jgi:hypothetical protein
MATTTKDRVMYAADTAKPYLGRALTDEEFRDNLRSAFAAARAIYEELSRQRGISIAATAATDEDIHSNLRRAIKELRQAADRIQAREQKRKSHTFRNVALVLGGVAIGIFFNPYTGPAARRWATKKATGSSSSSYSTNGAA